MNNRQPHKNHTLRNIFYTAFALLVSVSFHMLWIAPTLRFTGWMLSLWLSGAVILSSLLVLVRALVDRQRAQRQTSLHYRK